VTETKRPDEQHRPGSEAATPSGSATAIGREAARSSDRAWMVRPGHRQPGGRKVIVALENALGLASGSLDHEREVLESHGNMSAPTVLFVLERVIAD